jgi:hypothetical protein
MQNMASGMRALAAGQEAQGRGFAQAGQQVARGIDTFAQSFKVDDDLTDAQTRADFMSEMAQIRSERENEFDPAKLDQFPQRFESVRQKYAQKYGDPLRARKFLIETQDDLTKATIQTNERKIGIQRNAEVGRNVETLERLKREAHTEKDETEKSKRISAGSEIYDGMARNGLMTPAQAFAAKQKWVKDYVITDHRMRSPEERVVAEQGWRGALKVRESRNNHRAENDFGFAGLYQFGAPRLQTIGVYQPGANENLGGWNKSSATAPGKWTGQFNIPGFPGVRTKAEFLASPEAQERVFEIHQQRMDKELKDMGLEKYIGTTRGGVTLTRESIYAMMHLGGPGGAADALRGVRDREDAYGTKVMEYAKLGTSGPSKMLDILDPDERQLLTEETARESMQRANIVEQERRATAAVMESERKARIDTLEVGIMDDTMTRADFLQARAAGVIRDEPETIRKIEGLLKQQEERIERRSLSEGIVTGTVAYNPTDEAHRKALDERVEFAARATGRPKEDVAAEVYNVTGMMPKAGVTALRGMSLRNTPEDIIKAGQMAASAMFKVSDRFPNGNPRVFDSFDGGKELTELGTMWAHFRGLMGDDDGSEAAKAIMELRAKDYKSGVNFDQKEEAEFKKNIKENAIKDFSDAKLFGSGSFYDNKLLPDGMKNAMLEDYASETMRFYKKYGNESLARGMAMNNLKTVYGVSNGYIQKFPVEKALADMSINGSHDWAYKAAADRVAAATSGRDKPDPKDVFFTEIPMETSDGFRTKSPNTFYRVMYMKNVDGMRVPEQLNAPFAPGQHFSRAHNEFQTKRDADVRKEWEKRKALEALKPPRNAEEVRTRAGVIPADPAAKQAKEAKIEELRKGVSPYDELQKKLGLEPEPAPVVQPRRTRAGVIPPPASTRNRLPDGNK